jgi:hypothetical protein
MSAKTWKGEWELTSHRKEQLLLDKGSSIDLSQE